MFNASNIEQPILATLSDKTYSAFLPSYSKTLDIFLQQEQAVLKDSIYLTSFYTLLFYAVQTVQESIQVLP